MRRSPVSTCDVITSEDKKTILYCLRLESGQSVQKKFEDYEKFYIRISYLLPAAHSPPPKKKLLQGESKLIEKRKCWIMSVSQTLLMHHSDCPTEDIREFYSLPTDDESEFLPKETKKAVPGDFEVLKTIGKGSFGRVFQVRHKESRKIYAMKVLMKETIKKKNETKHVMAELAVLKMNIYHPFLVSLHFSFQTKDKLYFILDNLNGGELFSHLQKEKHFNEARSRFYAADIASALGYLHENNIIYRDLKPENLLLDREGYIVLTDFGLCKEGMKAGVTTSTFCGTPEYLAPEIVLKKPYERSVDWWCLGAVLYEMLFGLPPFYSRDHQEMYDRIVNQPLRFKSQISAAATDMITGLLNKDAKKRLGYKTDFVEIKNHPFFMPIDFDKLLARQLRAPYIPKVANEYDTSLISDSFTNERFDPQSLVPEHLANSVHDFPSFTYVSKPVV